MSYTARQFIALILSISLFFVVVYEKSVSGQIDAKGMLASLGGTVLTGIGVSGLMTHTPPCVSEGQMCGEMAMDIGMIAGGILAMMAGQSTADAATGNSSAGGSGGGGGGGSEGLGDLGNFNYDYGNYNYNSNSNSNPYITTFCSDGTTCTVPDSVYKGLDTLANGLANGTIAPSDGMSAAETLDMASSNLAKLEDALSKLQDKLNNDTDNGTNLLGEKSTVANSLGSLNFGDDMFSGMFKKNGDKNAKAQAPVRVNGLDAEDVTTGRKLSLFERATRRYNGTRDYNRAFTVARMELLRKRAKEYAKKNADKKDQLARSPASIDKSKNQNSIAVKTVKE